VLGRNVQQRWRFHLQQLHSWLLVQRWIDVRHAEPVLGRDFFTSGICKLNRLCSAQPAAAATEPQPAAAATQPKPAAAATQPQPAAAAQPTAPELR
jgi:hypothetical protein